MRNRYYLISNGAMIGELSATPAFAPVFASKAALRQQGSSSNHSATILGEDALLSID